MSSITAFYIFISVTTLTGIALYFEMKRRGAIKAIKSQKEFYQPFVQHFEGHLVELGNVGGKYVYEGVYRGYKFSNYIGLTRKNTGDSVAGIVLVTNEITLELPRESDHRLLIYRTAPGAVFSMKRIRTSDPDFDGKCYVYSDNAAKGQLYFSDLNRRKALLRLVEDGWADKIFSVMSLGNKDIQIWKFYDPTCSEPDFIRRTLDNLIVLAEGL